MVNSEVDISIGLNLGKASCMGGIIIQVLDESKTSSASISQHTSSVYIPISGVGIRVEREVLEKVGLVEFVEQIVAAGCNGRRCNQSEGRQVKERRRHGEKYAERSCGLVLSLLLSEDEKRKKELSRIENGEM